MEDNSRTRAEDMARLIVHEVTARVAGLDRQQMDSLRELLNERFAQVHADLKSHTATLEDLRLKVAALATQSALNGRDLEFLKAEVGKLSHEVHENVIPRLREVEKGQSRDAPVVAGVGKVVMAIILAVAAAMMGFLLRGQTP